VNKDRIAKKYAEETIENIKKLKKIAPKEFKKKFNFNKLERICKEVLEKDFPTQNS